MSHRLAVAFAFLMVPLAAAPIRAQAPVVADAALKAPEIIAFIGLKPGDRLADVVGGKLTPALAHAVGPKGKVYSLETAEYAKVHPDALLAMQTLAAASLNVVVSADPVMAPLPAKLDAVFIRQNYHDLYDAFMGPADVPAFNRAVFAALKPGGVYVVLDHAAAAGAPMTVTQTLHRIDPARVKADVLAAGFTLDGESAVLANPADDHSLRVFDPTIRGHSDQFLLRFRKPG